MYTLNDAISILVENGYMVTCNGREVKQMPTERGPEDTWIHEARAVHRSVPTRYTSKGLSPKEAVNKLLLFVKSGAPLDPGKHKEKEPKKL